VTCHADTELKRPGSTHPARQVTGTVRSSTHTKQFQRVPQMAVSNP